MRVWTYNIIVIVTRQNVLECWHSTFSLFLWLQEVDIWSFGCLLLELLTLQVPYSGLSESQIHDLLQVPLSLSRSIENECDFCMLVLVSGVRFVFSGMEDGR